MLLGCYFRQEGLADSEYLWPRGIQCCWGQGGGYVCAHTLANLQHTLLT